MITTQPCKLLRAHKQMQKKETNASVTLNRIPKSSVYIYRVLKFFFFPFDHCFKPGQGGGGAVGYRAHPWRLARSGRHAS
jgi:hypothetical protein